MSRMTLSADRHARAPSRHPQWGWLLAALMTSVAVVACVVIAAAWIVGGRAAPVTSSVQELLPPEPRQSPSMDSGDAETAAVSAPQPPVPLEIDAVIGETAAHLPDALGSPSAKEIPEGSLEDLKALGWAVAFLDREGFSHDAFETSAVDGERTVQVHLTDGSDFINVAETRAEAENQELDPLRDKLSGLVDLSSVRAESIELSTGHESTVYGAEDAEYWTAAIETPAVQYVVTTSLPPAAAQEVASWVMVTDRSRVHMSQTAPGPTDRLERGFDEMLDWFEAQ